MNMLTESYLNSVLVKAYFSPFIMQNKTKPTLLFSKRLSVLWVLSLTVVKISFPKVPYTVASTRKDGPWKFSTIKDCDVFIYNLINS